MTREEILGKYTHKEAGVWNPLIKESHARKAMVEYAIAVLEELRIKLAEGDMRYPVNAVDRKILELKPLIK